MTDKDAMAQAVIGLNPTQARQIKILAEALADAYMHLGAAEKPFTDSIAQECAEAERALHAYLGAITVTEPSQPQHPEPDQPAAPGSDT